MAVKNNKISEKINMLSQLALVVKFCRFFLFFYASISFIFWFLNCIEVNWLYLFNWLFVIPYQIVSTFYKPDAMSADFSLAIIGGLSLLLGFILDFVYNNLMQKISELQEEEERLKNERRLKRRKAPQIPQVQQQMASNTEMPTVDSLNIEQRPVENPKLLFIISPHINKIKRKQDDLELTFQEVEVWKQRVNKKLLENINYSKPMQKGYYRKNLFLMYKDFNYVDDFIYYIKQTIDSIIIEFKRYGISVTFCNVLSSITDTAVLEKELDCMDTILSLNFLNEIIVTNRFKITYDNKVSQQYLIKIKGEYNLSKNLTITNRQPVYSLTEKKQKENT